MLKRKRDRHRGKKGKKAEVSAEVSCLPDFWRALLSLQHTLPEPPVV